MFTPPSIFDSDGAPELVYNWQQVEACAVARGVIPTGPDHMCGHLQQICNHPFATWFWAVRCICSGVNWQAKPAVNILHIWPPSTSETILDLAFLPVGFRHSKILLFLPAQGELTARLFLGLTVL